MKRHQIVAVVGTGFMARTHLAAYANLPTAQVKYVVSRNKASARQSAELYGAEGVSSLEHVLADPSVDVVDLTVPTPLHRDFALAALAAGKHVIVEKPISLTSNTAKEMILAAKQAGRSLMVAHVLRFWPVYERIAEIVKTNVLGKPLHASTYRLASPPSWSTWLSDTRQTGGAAIDLGIHDIDFLNSMFGAPKSVQAWGTYKEAGLPLHYVASISYKGLTAIAEASMAMPKHFPFTAGIRLHLEGGVIEHHYRAGGASFEQGEAVDTTTLTPTGAPPTRLDFANHDPFEKQLGHFLESLVNEEEKLIVTAEDAHLALATSIAINHAVQTAGRIEI